MTLIELKELIDGILGSHPELGDEKLWSTSDYGDRGHTQQIAKVEDLIFTPKTYNDELGARISHRYAYDHSLYAEVQEDQ